MISNDPFERMKTDLLARIARSTTPRNELDKWVATGFDYQWTVKGGWATATDGTRDDNGVCIVVDRMQEYELRECVAEQLQHYGVTDTRINSMMA